MPPPIPQNTEQYIPEFQRAAQAASGASRLVNTLDVALPITRGGAALTFYPALAGGTMEAYSKAGARYDYQYPEEGWRYEGVSDDILRFMKRNYAIQTDPQFYADAASGTQTRVLSALGNPEQVIERGETFSQKATDAGINLARKVGFNPSERDVQLIHLNSAPATILEAVTRGGVGMLGDLGYWLGEKAYEYGKNYPNNIQAEAKEYNERYKRLGESAARMEYPDKAPISILQRKSNLEEFKSSLGE